MVHCKRDGHDGYWIVAEPNRSASWRTNQLILLGAGLWLLGIAAVFLVAGLWLVLPFAGLELGALGAALYWTSWRLRERHVVHFTAEHIHIEKGHRGPRRAWCLPRREAALSVAIHNHPEDPLQLTLYTATERVRVGEFLNKEDARTLLQLLRNAGVQVRNYSRTGQLQL